MSLTITSPFRGLESIVQEHYPLRRHTWYRIGGPARYFIQPTSDAELAEAVRRCHDNGIPMFVLGLGANLLIRDEGIDGAVFRLSDAAMASHRFEGAALHAGAGADLQKLIIRAVREGLSGIETLVGIPGTIGGAVRMNAGGRFGDIGTVVESVRVMNADGSIDELRGEQIEFGYRSTSISAPFILSAILRLDRDDPDQIVKRSKDVWMYKRNTQPLNGRSCGCIFKNPGEGQSAGGLIDQTGLKGLRIGMAEVSQKHANFMIAHPECPSSDVLQLIKQVQQRVYDRHGVMLKPEVRVWPDLPPM
jgi:UDP-N-acetylmuramate dehydrogenase